MIPDIEDPDDPLERELAEALRSDAPENLLRANLGRIADKFDSPDGLENPPGNPRSRRGRWWIWAAAGLVLLAGAALFFKNSDKKEPSAPASNPPNLETPQSIEPSQPAPTPPPEPTKTPKTQKTEPIAATFRPLPPLEREIGTQVRGGDLKVKIAAPAHAATLTRLGGQVDFKLSGNIEGWQASSSARLEAQIFSNDRTAWEAARPLYRHRISPEVNGHFVWEEKLPLGTGVFYLLIEDSDSGEWTFVDKFFVK